MLNELLKGDDIDAIRNAVYELSNKSDAVFTKLYQQNAANGQANGGPTEGQQQ